MMNGLNGQGIILQFNMDQYNIYMIKTFCLFTRLPFATSKLTSTIFSPAIKNLTKTAVFSFSNQQNQANVQAQSQPFIEGEDRASNFYRKSIRRININDKGRGKFTEHTLLRLIKLTERVDQQPLLFQAFYNYLGHFTVISSTTVDKMLLKALSFEGCSQDKIIQILENHNHLGYFPHYNVTRRTIEVTANHQDKFHKLLQIFISSPLIKFDQEIVQGLLERIKEPTLNNTTLSLIIKLLAQREHFKLLDGIIGRRELLKRLVESIEGRLNNKTFKTFRRSDTLKQWCGEILSSEPVDDVLHYELAVLSVTGKHHSLFGDNLLQIKDQQKLVRCLLYLQESPESFTKVALKYLNQLDISDDLKTRLQQFKPSNTDPASVQSE